MTGDTVILDNTRLTEISIDRLQLNPQEHKDDEINDVDVNVIFVPKFKNQKAKVMEDA